MTMKEARKVTAGMTTRTVTEKTISCKCYDAANDKIVDKDVPVAVLKKHKKLPFSWDGVSVLMKGTEEKSKTTMYAIDTEKFEEACRKDGKVITIED